MKEVRINVRTTELIKRELEIAAELRGLTVSSLVNSLAVKTIREEKQIAPEAFAEQASGRSVRSVRKTRRPDRQVTNWREALENAKGIWKDRDDLPDWKDLRAEADYRIERWNKDK